MGYVTQARGQITITPPIPWAQANGTEWMPDDWNGPDVKFVLTETPVDGGAFTRQAVAVVQRDDSEPRNYQLAEDLQRLIDAYPGHEFTGRFDCHGESAGDIWRLEVHGRQAVKVEPRIVWPDGTETTRRDYDR